MITHAERMATDPAYTAHFNRVVAEAPPLSDEQLHSIAGHLGLAVRPQPVQRKKTA